MFKEDNPTCHKEHVIDSNESVCVAIYLIKIQGLGRVVRELQLGYLDTRKSLQPMHNMASDLSKPRWRLGVIKLNEHIFL